MGDEHGCFFNLRGLLGSPEKRYQQLAETLIPITPDCLQGEKQTCLHRAEGPPLRPLPVLPAQQRRGSAVADVGSRDGDGEAGTRPWCQQPRAQCWQRSGEDPCSGDPSEAALTSSDPNWLGRITAWGGRWGCWGGILNTTLFFFKGLRMGAPG